MASDDGLAPAIKTSAGAPKTAAAASKRFWVFLPAGLFLGLTGLFLYALNAGDPSKLPSALIGKPVPQFALPAVDGLVEAGQPVQGFSDADLRGSPIAIVNVFASWCGPCHQEHPVLTELVRASGAPAFGLNYKDDAEAARRFLGRYGNPYARVGADRTGRTAIDWGVYGVPETFIVNGRGEIIHKHVGPLTDPVVRDTLLPIIARERQAAKP